MRKRKPLTDTAVKNAKPGTILRDGRGFYLLVTPSGAKSWRWKYRYRGFEKLATFGVYPDVSLEVARTRCQTARTLLASGVDPMAVRAEQKQKERDEVAAKREQRRNTFAAVALQWHTHWKQGQTERHAAYVWSRFERDILPLLGHHPIVEITSLDVVKMLHSISDRGVADLAKRAMQVTKSVFSYAVTHQIIPHSPVAHLKPKDILPKTTKQNYARVDAKELPALLAAIDGYAGEQTRLAMQLMAHTFVRTSELIGTTWDEIDGERWTIPASRMKMKTPHHVPLSKQSVAILLRLKELAGDSVYVFPGLKPNQPMSNGTILVALKRMGYAGKMTGHGFRGIASTILHEQGYEHEHIELQLAHSKRDAVSAAYNHALHLKARTAMMQHWSDYLDKQRQPKVVSIA